MSNLEASNPPQSSAMRRSRSSNQLGDSKGQPITPKSRHGDVSLGGANPVLAKSIQREDLLPEKVTVVLKIGSSSVMSADGKHPNLSTLSKFCELVCELMRKNYSVVIVSSGAVSIGCQRLGLTERPKQVVTKQAVAAVGQGRLLRLYDDLFSMLGQPIAQVLLSRENIALEHHYRNALNTFKELLRLGVVPIVNENDTVAMDELRFGDNDTLSALVASLVRAHWLFLLTDVDALYTADPRTNPDAKPIRVVEDIGDLLVDTSGNAAGGTSNSMAAVSGPAAAAAAAGVPAPPAQSGKWGTGGMATKLQAATIATAAGVRTAVCSTDKLDDVRRMLEGSTEVGTQFIATQRAITGHKKWIAQGLRPQGTLVIDDGAAKSILAKHSLFAAGIVAVEGTFPHHSGVKIVNKNGREIARGLTTYSAADLNLIKGLKSKHIFEKLGYDGPEVVIHRGNLVVLPSAISSASAGTGLTSPTESLGRVPSSSSLVSFVDPDESSSEVKRSDEPIGVNEYDLYGPSPVEAQSEGKNEEPTEDEVDDVSDGECFGNDVLTDDGQL